MCWLSIVTVVKDDPDGFARTMSSIADQKIDGIEWVVVDGSSHREQILDIIDGTPGLPSVRFANQRPQGIYRAMNQALRMATGTYVLFLNAGDSLHDAMVVSRLRDALADRPQWAFGPVEVIETDGRSVITPAWDYAREKRAGFARGHFPAHQGTVGGRALMLECGGFDEQYRIAADYALALRMSEVADPVVLPFVVATFREGGASTQHWRESFREFHRARREILRPRGFEAVREQWETVRHFGLVFGAREVRSRLSWWARR